jgi:hypothetical protein
MSEYTIESYLELAQATLSVDEMRKRFPADWDRACDGLDTIWKATSAEELADRLRQIKSAAESHLARVQKSRGNRKTIEAAVIPMLRYHAARIAVKNFYLTNLSKPDADGKVRLSLFNGLVLQRLLFRRGFERRAPSMAAFRFWWKIVGQHELLLFLCQKRGIYCFYSRDLVRELARLAAGRPCLEIAAGDGTLTRFLRREGVDVVATDSHDWPGIEYPDFVEKLDAREALRKYPRPVVLCSWPPPFNRFEHLVFQSPAVRTYVVIGSCREFGTGDWKAYEQATPFAWERSERLASLMIPPELDSAVFVFQRKA